MPRWTGDANFMPIIARTTVMPELIPVTYAKVRAEVVRECDPTIKTATLIVADNMRDRVCVTSDGRFPTIDIEPGIAVWKSALSWARECGQTAEVRGWAGGRRSDRDRHIALHLTVSDPIAVAGIEWAHASVARDLLRHADFERLDLARELWPAQG